MESSGSHQAVDRQSSGIDQEKSDIHESGQAVIKQLQAAL